MTTAADLELALQGNIERFKLPEIFQLLSYGRKNGTLAIQRDSDIVMVYFREGLIVYGYGPRQTFHIGQLLKERGVITPTQLAMAVAVQNEGQSNKRLGQILMDLKVVDRADIIEVVRAQVEELLYSLMSWERGAFKFYENQYPTEEEITVDISTENVILEGLRRLDEMNHLRDTLPDMDAVFTFAQATEGRAVDIALSPEEWNLLALVDSRRSIRDIVEISNLSEVDSLKKLAALKLAGLVATTEATSDAQFIAGHLEEKMTRLAGMMEVYLSGSHGDTTRPTTRMVGARPLREIIEESTIEKSTKRSGTDNRPGPMGAPRMEMPTANSSDRPAIGALPGGKSGASAVMPPHDSGEKLWNDFGA